MVSWGDGEESSSEVSSDESGNGIRTIYDSEYYGSDDGVPAVRCKCRKVAGRFVSFDGCTLGRRFLGCNVQESSRCNFIRWIDPSWPSHLEKALGTLWQQNAKLKRDRTEDALDNMEKGFKYQAEIEKLHKDLRMAQDELKNAVNEKQGILALKANAEQAYLDAKSELEHKKIVEANHSNMHKVLRVKAEKDRDQLKLEKKKLEYIISDLLRQREGTRAKMRKIQALCDD